MNFPVDWFAKANKLKFLRQATRAAAAKFAFWRPWLLTALILAATFTHASERDEPVNRSATPDLYTALGKRWQTLEAGHPGVQSFPSTLFSPLPNNFRILIRPDGRLLFSNGAGLVLFDGAHWQLFRHPEKFGPLSKIALLPDGRVVAAFPDDPGFFAADVDGVYQWHSLRARMPKKYQDIGRLASLIFDSARSGVWFVRHDAAIFLPINSTHAPTVIPAPKLFLAAYRVGEEVWIFDAKDKLFRILGGSGAEMPLKLEAIAGSEALGSVPVAILPSSNKFALMLANGNLWQLSEAKLTPQAQEKWPEWNRKGISTVSRLSDGNIAIGFGRAPPCLINDDGSSEQCYQTTDGIPPERVYSMIEDSSAGLWLAQSNGITRIDRGTATTHFDRLDGVAAAESLVRWQGKLHVATGLDLLVLEPTHANRDQSPSQFTPHPWQRTTYAAVAIGKSLLLNSSGPAFLMSPDQQAIQLAANWGIVYGIWPSHRRTDSAFVSATKGLHILEIGSGNPIVTPIWETEEQIYGLHEQDADTLWLANPSKSIWRMQRLAGRWQPPERFEMDRGLPSGKLSLAQSNRNVWVYSDQGAFLFDPASQRFAQPVGLPKQMRDQEIRFLEEDAEGNLWVQTAEAIAVAWLQSDGASLRWHWDPKPLRALSPAVLTTDIVREQSIVWLLRRDGLTRVDLAAQLELGTAPVPALTEMRDLRRDQRVSLASGTVFDVNLRDLRFSFGVSDFERPSGLLWRTRLQGFDANFSPWDTRSERSYTNLPDGELAFEVQSRLPSGQVTEMQPQRLVIATPWYRSTLAILSYFLGLALLLWLTAKFGARARSRVLLVRQRELESVVANRTQELNEKNHQLAEHAQRLTELDKLKTNFFINVGHEFRTPLTLVLGPIDDLLRDARERFSSRAREQLEMANRNARRVLDLIVELLDVNRFEHGQMRLTRLPSDIEALVRHSVADNAELVSRFGHRIQFERDDAYTTGVENAWFAAVDVMQIERCLSNLISNAAKYMARGGVIEIHLARAEAHILISISDQGRGIAPEAVAHVFDRFFQAESSDRASGYGIGLALVHQIIEAHQGRIGVESTLGVGTRFQIELAALVVSANAQVAANPEYVATNTAAQILATPLSSEPSNDAAELAPKLRVLVIDDHDDLRARVRALLEFAPFAAEASPGSTRARYDVIEANDGPSAWTAACEDLPDLIISDVMMPGFDGVELSRRLRSNPDTATIPLLLLTAKVGSEHAVAGLNAGADDYLAKPFDASELLARVDALLARGHRLRLRMLREAQAVALVAMEPAILTVPTSENSGTAELSGADARWRERLDAQIERHLSDADWGIEALSAAMHVDRSQLFRRCKELLAMSPSDYLRERRLARASDLLSNNAGSISEVAYAVGFVSLSSFTRAFKAHYNVAPSQRLKGSPRRAS